MPSALPYRSTARVSIEGDAEKVIASLSRLNGADISVNVTLQIYVKSFGQFGGRELYIVPAIDNGNPDNALRSVEGLFNQTRISLEEYNALIDAIGRITAYTK